MLVKSERIQILILIENRKIITTNFLVGIYIKTIATSFVKELNEYHSTSVFVSKQETNQTTIAKDSILGTIKRKLLTLKFLI